MGDKQATICMAMLTQYSVIPGAHDQKLQLAFNELPSFDSLLTAAGGDSDSGNSWVSLVEGMEVQDVLDYSDAYVEGGLEFECIVDGETVGSISFTQWPLY